MMSRSKKSSVKEVNVAKVLSKMGYRMGKTIGKGTYSKVCVAVNNMGHKVACKIIDKEKSGEEFIKKFLPRELKILTNIEHPNIVKVFNVLEVNKKVYVFMDYCKNGDLLEHLRNRGPMTEEETKVIFGQIADAVHYLHSLDISHRDLKCENVFLLFNNNVKLGDFGFARYCRDSVGNYLLSDTFCGSAAYAAPEILQGLYYDPKMYDIWALGCILYTMLNASLPFDDSNIRVMVKEQTSRKIRKVTQTWDECSKNLRRLQNSLLEPDVMRRITINQVIRHPWFKQDSLSKYNYLWSVSDSLLL